jgi:hypothetical protein
MPHLDFDLGHDRTARVACSRQPQGGARTVDGEEGSQDVGSEPEREAFRRRMSLVSRDVFCWSDAADVVLVASRDAPAVSVVMLLVSGRARRPGACLA